MWRYLEVDGVFIGRVSGQPPLSIEPDIKQTSYAGLRGKTFKNDDQLMAAVRAITPKAYRVAILVDDAAVIKMMDQLGIDIPVGPANCNR
jgi:hypothetical protein